jgi:hypothetical protein
MSDSCEESDPRRASCTLFHSAFHVKLGRRTRQSMSKEGRIIISKKNIPHMCIPLARRICAWSGGTPLAGSSDSAAWPAPVCRVNSSTVSENELRPTVGGTDLRRLLLWDDGDTGARIDLPTMPLLHAIASASIFCVHHCRHQLLPDQWSSLSF